MAPAAVKSFSAELLFMATSPLEPETNWEPLLSVMFPLFTSTEISPAFAPPTALMLLVLLANRLPVPVTSMSTLPPDVLTSPSSVMLVAASSFTKPPPPLLRRAVALRLRIPAFARASTDPVPAPPPALICPLMPKVAPAPVRVPEMLPPELVIALDHVMPVTAVQVTFPPDVLREFPVRAMEPVRLEEKAPPPVLIETAAFCVNPTPLTVIEPPPESTFAPNVVEPPPELSLLALNTRLTRLETLSPPA